MNDRFSTFSDSVTAPSRRLAALAPNDAADLAEVPKAIYVGTGGDIALIAADAPAGDTGVIFRNVPAAFILDVRARRVLATGTTAADLIALL